MNWNELASIGFRGDQLKPRAAMAGTDGEDGRDVSRADLLSAQPFTLANDHSQPDSAHSLLIT